jgi:hypothetical protein
VIVIGLEAQRVVSFEEGKALADSYRTNFIETSAKNSSNVEAAFLSMVIEAKARDDRRKERLRLRQQRTD